MMQELNNSDCFRIEGLECLPNFRAPIAKPYFFKYKNVVAFCTGIHHNIVWGQLAQTVYEFKYVRHFDPFSTADSPWVKLSGKYGWSWGDPEVGQDFTGGTTSPDRFIAKNPVSDFDGTGDTLTTIVGNIRDAQAKGPSPYSPDQLDRLDAIANRLRDPNLDISDPKNDPTGDKKTETHSLIEEARGILKGGN